MPDVEIVERRVLFLGLTVAECSCFVPAVKSSTDELQHMVYSTKSMFDEPRTARGGCAALLAQQLCSGGIYYITK